MTTLDDLFLELSPVGLDHASPLVALQALWEDPDTRWYAQRRYGALAAAGVLVGATFNPNLHPRGHDGKFIEIFGFVRWFDTDKMTWRNGVVMGIQDDGHITVKGQYGDFFTFQNPKLLYARPKPKARMKLPSPGTVGGDVPGFNKVGGQGGSNPGGFYEVTNPTAVLAGPSDSPDITAGHKMQQRLRLLSATHSTQSHWEDWTDETTAALLIPTEFDTVQVPRLDGTEGRYDVLERGPGNHWYRVPAAGTMVTDDLYDPNLAVSNEDAFGAPGSARRKAVLADDNVFAFTRDPTVSPDDLALAVRQAASTPVATGDQFYVKKMNLPERARNEALANDLYELSGTAVPEVSVGADGLTVASKLIGEKTNFDPDNPAHVKAAQGGFVFDAWLANWDAVGLGYDNMQIGPDGTAWRIDSGGALLYRAQGKPKGAAFGPEVTELDSLRSSINPQAASVYGSISQDQLQEQAEILRSISPYQITQLAESYDLPEVADILIARRASILAQIPLDPAPEVDVPDVKVVYNPVEQVMQPGKPPETAVKNWTWAMGNLPKVTLSAGDLSDDDSITEAVHLSGGELWTFDSGLEPNEGNVASFQGRNLFTGQTQRIYLLPGDQVLGAPYTAGAPETGQIVDDLTVQRDLAMAEIVSTTMGRSIDDIMNDTDWKMALPAELQPFDVSVGGLESLHRAIDDGRLPADGPIYSTWNKKIYAIEDWNDGEPWQVTLRESGSNDTLQMGSNGFLDFGPWVRPGNDTTEGLYRARLTAGPDDEGGVGVTEAKATIADTVATAPDSTGWNDFGDDTPAPPATMDEKSNQMFDILNNPDISNADKDAAGKEYLLADQAVKNGGTPPPMPTFDKLVAQHALTTEAGDTLETLASEKAGVDAAKAAVASLDGVQIDPDTHLATVLGPQTALHTSMMSVDELDEYQLLVGQNVVVLPDKVFNDPAGDHLITYANGLVKVTKVEKNAKGVIWLTGLKGNGEVVNAKLVGPGTTIPKAIIPVAADPIPQALTYKKNGEIVVGTRLVGHWHRPYENPQMHTGSWTAVIQGDESIIGVPMVAVGNNKSAMTSAVAGLVVPQPPVLTKKKKAEALKAEGLIAKYTAEYTPEVTAQVTAELTAKYAKPAAGSTAMGDGSAPVVGSWVYAPKDNTWWKVTVAAPAAKKEKAGEFVRVQRFVDGKKMDSHRARKDLYPVAGEGSLPTAIAVDNIVTTGDGHKAGPGSMVTWGGVPVQILETKSGTQVKVKTETGGVHWTDAANTQAPSGFVSPGIVSTLSDAELQAQIDATVNATVSEMVAAALAKDLPPATPKAKKAVSVVTYPGPGGSLVHQDSVYAEQRTQKGLKLLKDGYAPAVGQVLRHNDGTRYTVIEVGLDWKANKNSVRVIPEGGGYYDGKWRVITTMVVDHEAMLTTKDGDPLPRIASIDGVAADHANGSIIWRRDENKFVGYTDAGQARYKNFSSYYVVSPDGSVTDINTGKILSAYYLSEAIASGTRVGMIDKTAGDKKLTVSMKEGITPNSFYGTSVESFVIHDPTENGPLLNAGGPSMPAPVPSPSPPPAPPHPDTSATLSNGQVVTVGDVVTTPQGDSLTVKEVLFDDDGNVQVYVADPGFGGDEYWLSDAEFLGMHTTTQTALPPTPVAPATLTLDDGTVVSPGMQVNVIGEPAPVTITHVNPEYVDYTDAAGVPSAVHKSGISPLSTGVTPPTPAPVAPPPPPPATGVPDLSGPLPDFTGTIGPELPHAPVTSSAQGAGTPALTPSGQVGALDAKPSALGSGPVNSTTEAIAESQAAVEANKAYGANQWVQSFATADSDLIEGMAVQTQVVRDAQGNEFIEARFRLSGDQAAKTRGRFLVAGGGDQFGNWAKSKVDIHDIVVGDQVSVKQSSQNAVQLKPNEVDFPNATVTVGPQLVGKGTGEFAALDLYRVEVAFPNGTTGVLELLSGHAKPFYRYAWDPSLAVKTTGNEQLNPNAKNLGWAVKSTRLGYDRAGSGQAIEHHDDGAKRLGGQATPFTVQSQGSSHTLERTADGVTTQYQTSSVARNNLNGHVVIRVAADDPNAQAKISAAMETVGVPADRQGPPSAEDLGTMALEQVWRQFHPTYTENQKPNVSLAHPEEALDLIDKELGKYLGRKATLADISYRIGDDGRVQVLLSPEVADAVTKRNGVTHYLHGINASSWQAAVENSIVGAAPGLMGSVDRLQNGVMIKGASTETDHVHGGADRLFMRASKKSSTVESAYLASGYFVFLNPQAVHRQVNVYFANSDAFGQREMGPGADNRWLDMNSLANSNELLVPRVETKLWGRVRVTSEYERQQLLKNMHAKGITTAPNGMALEDFFITGSVPTADLPPPVFGDEIGLDTLLSAASAPAAV